MFQRFRIPVWKVPKEGLWYFGVYKTNICVAQKGVTSLGVLGSYTNNGHFSQLNTWHLLCVSITGVYEEASYVRAMKLLSCLFQLW